MTEFKNDTSKQVYYRTYSRTKPDGSQEQWPETVRRVVDGNLKLVEPRYIEEGEREALIDLIESFKVLPAGRHLKSSGVNDFALNNCWAAGWDSSKPEEHFTFTLLRLAEGGGVGSNYSSRYLEDYPAVQVPVSVHIVCDPEHQDYEDMVEAGLISTEYSHTWAGAYAVEDSREGWAEALGDLIRTAHDPKTRHTQRVYDVSRVRCKGSPLKTFGGTASGPAPFAEMMSEIGSVLAYVFRESGAADHIDGIDAMNIDHSIAKAIVAGGVRRSARMSIMRWDDDLIFDFINIKKEGGHWTTNISVEVDQNFLEHLDTLTTSLGPFDGSLYHVHDVLTAIAEGMLHNGEPGVWNSALTAEGEVDGIYVTNPCGEATLTPWEPCNLGSVNLAAFVDGDGSVDYEGLSEAHRYITRYLIRATFADVADPKSAEAIARYRRIGVGHLGFADWLYKQGIKYTEATEVDGNGYVASMLTEWADEVDEAAAEYANELRIPVPIKKRVIAPTGTISKLAGVSGEATHAPFAAYFIRRIRFSNVDPNEVAQVDEYRRQGYRVEPCQYAANTSVVEIPTKDSLLDELEYPEYFQHAGDLTIRDMLNVQRMYQEYWADQAVSYTANVDPGQYSADELSRLLAEFLPELKGVTVFPEMSMPQSPYERVSFEEYKARAEEVGIEVTDTGFDEVCASGSCGIV
jgi:ribonucleoside-triphosphate reductase